MSSLMLLQNGSVESFYDEADIYSRVTQAGANRDGLVMDAGSPFMCASVDNLGVKVGIFSTNIYEE